jgi:hypothetical protein
MDIKAGEFLSGELPGVQLTGDVWTCQGDLSASGLLGCAKRSRWNNGKEYKDLNKEKA